MLSDPRAAPVALAANAERFTREERIPCKQQGTGTKWAAVDFELLGSYDPQPYFITLLALVADDHLDIVKGQRKTSRMFISAFAVRVLERLDSFLKALCC
jgi:hypothetical protein